MLGLALRPALHHFMLGVAAQLPIAQAVELIDDLGAVDPFEQGDIVFAEQARVQHGSIPEGDRAVTNGHKLIIFLPLANRLFYPASVYSPLRLADGMTEPPLAIPPRSQERLGIFL
jgi:hypothetical protein